jgi:hypothetical protein
MTVIKITTLFISVLVVALVFMVVTDSCGYAFDKKKIQDAKSSAGDLSYHLNTPKAPYYGYPLRKCITEDIVDKKNEMAAPEIQQKAKACIKSYRAGFENLQAKYDDWKTKSRALRDALQDEK